MDNQNLLKRINKLALFFGIIIILGIPASIAFFITEYYILNIVTLIAMITLVVIISINIIISLLLQNKVFDARKKYIEMLEKQKEMQENYLRYKRRFRFIVLLSGCYQVLLLLLTMVINTAIFAFYSKVFVAEPILEPCFILAISVLIFSYQLAVFVSATKSYTASVGGELLAKDQYPKIYQLATEAALKIGANSNFTLKVVPGANASVFNEKNNSLTILLGIDLLNILNQDELKTVLIHEFAHAKKDTKLSYRIHYRMNRWQDIKEKKNFFPSFLFKGVALVVIKQSMLFQSLSSFECEVNADKMIIDENDRQHAVNAFAKLEMLSMHNFNLPIKNYYINEEMPEQLVEFNKKTFLAAYQRNEKIWKEAIIKQIRPQVTSHPSFPERMENLKINNFNIEFISNDDAYNCDIKKISEIVNQYIKETINWTVCHQSQYLCYQKIVDIYSVNPQAYTDLYDVAYAYFCLCDYENSEKMIVEILKNENNAAALFLLGIIKCSRLDDSGLQDLFNSANNINNAEKMISYVGTYLQYRGDEALIKTVKNEFNERLADTVDVEMMRLRKIKNEKLVKDEIDKIRTLTKGMKNIDGMLLMEKKTPKKTFMVLVYSVLDENHHNIAIDNAKLGSFIIKECPTILFGGMVNFRSYIELANKFKYRIKDEIDIKEINQKIVRKPHRDFVDPTDAQIKKDEVCIWQGGSCSRFSRGVTLLVVCSFIIFIIGGIVGYIDKNNHWEYLIVMPLFVVVIAAFAMKSISWIAVTEKKFCYNSYGLLFYYNYEEIFKIKIVKRLTDYILGTKSVVVRSVQIWASPRTNDIWRRKVGNSYLNHLTDAEGLVAAIKEAMLKESRNAPNKNSPPTSNRISKW